jgi:hypothetical protein
MSTVILTKGQNWAEVELTKGHIAKIDLENVDQVEGRCWRYDGGYAKAGRSTWMHREILGLALDDPRRVDHRNHDTLDNRRSNLRIATPTQNAANRRKPEGSTSAYKGVGWSSKQGKWAARIKIDGRLMHLGYFTSESVAARAYMLTIT